MKAIPRIALAIAAVALAPGSADAQSVYRWVDKAGKVHYSDQPPPEEVKNVQQKRVGGGGPVEVSQLPYATQVAMRKSPAVLYGAASCGDLCVRGRELLARRGVPFSERDVLANPADAETVRKLVGSAKVPLLTLGEVSVKGFDEAQWHAALDTAGYPRTVLPGQRPPPVPPKPPVPAAPATAAPAAPAADAPK